MSKAKKKNNRYTITQVAKMMGLSRETIRGHVDDRNLKATKCGSIYFITQEDFDKFIQDRRKRGYYDDVQSG